MMFNNAVSAPCSPIPTRPRLKLPNGARIAPWVVPNTGHYEHQPLPSPTRDPWPRTLMSLVMAARIMVIGLAFGVYMKKEKHRPLVWLFTGQMQRIKYLEQALSDIMTFKDVWQTTPREIVAHYRKSMSS